MVHPASILPYVWGTMLPSSVWPFHLKSVRGLVTFRAGIELTLAQSRGEMETSKAHLKMMFKNRLYEFVIRLIGFIDRLPNDNVSRRLSDQLLKRE